MIIDGSMAHAQHPEWNVITDHPTNFEATGKSLRGSVPDPNSRMQTAEYQRLVAWNAKRLYNH